MGCMLAERAGSVKGEERRMGATSLPSRLAFVR